MPKVYKEVIRYIIIVCIMAINTDLSFKAYDLEVAGKLTLQFAGVVAASYGVLTLVLKFIFQTRVSDV